MRNLRNEPLAVKPDIPSTAPELSPRPLRVSAFEQVTSMMLSLLVLLSAAAVILFALWASNRLFHSQVAVPVVMEEIGTGEGSYGNSLEYDVPPGEDLDFEQPQAPQTLATVAAAVSGRAVALDDVALGDPPQGGPGGRGGRGGFGNNPRGSGGKPGRPRRWEIQFLEGNTIESYARQLDYFKLELGVLMPGDMVAYAYHLSKVTPDRRTGSVVDEKRYYLTWRRGDLEKVDRQLLTRAGIEAEGKPVLKFLPAEVEATLAQLERERAGNESKSVYKTRFGIRKDANKYTFYVLDQSYSYVQSGP
jgi:hypothetical protein